MKIPIHTHFFPWTILTRKVGQTELGFGMRTGFISRFVQDYNLCHSG